MINYKEMALTKPSEKTYMFISDSLFYNKNMIKIIANDIVSFVKIKATIPDNRIVTPPIIASYVSPLKEYNKKGKYKRQQYASNYNYRTDGVFDYGYIAFFDLGINDIKPYLRTDLGDYIFTDKTTEELLFSFIDFAQFNYTNVKDGVTVSCNMRDDNLNSMPMPRFNVSLKRGSTPYAVMLNIYAWTPVNGQV